MKENTTVFVVSSKFCGDFFIDAAFSTKQQAEDFITQHEMSSGYITELTIDKPSEDIEDIPFRPTPRQDERVNHPEHYQHPSGIECITIARHHDFLLHVGSITRHQCIHFVSHDYKRQIVTCKCPENHKLTDFEPNPFFQ